MKSKEMNKINRRILAFKNKENPVYKGRLASRINKERNQAKRQSRKLRGK